MNTLEILYQAFRVRYSLNQLQQILDRGCRLALLGPGDATAIIRESLGEPLESIDGHGPEEDLVCLRWDLPEQDLKRLKTCDACIVLYPDGAPEVEELEELAAKIPVYVKTLFVSLEESEGARSFHEKDLTLPTVRALPKGRAREKFLVLLLHSLPQVAMVMARNWSNLRAVFCRILTRRTALRNGIRSGISSLPLAAVPVIGPVLKMLATSAETMMLTSSQLRLSFVIAAVHGRPLDFFDRIVELWPIVGSAFGFRGMSRMLVKRLPGFGAGLKASIAFSGTFAVGEASRLFYEHGQPTSDEVRRELIRRSHEEGAREAHRLFRRVLVGVPLEDEDESGEEVLELVDELTNVKEKTSDEDVIEQLEAEEEARSSSERSLAEEPTVELQAVAPTIEDDIPAVKVEPEPEKPVEPEKKPRKRTKKSKPKGRTKKESSKKSGSKKSGSKSKKKSNSKKSKGKSQDKA